MDSNLNFEMLGPQTEVNFEALYAKTSMNNFLLGRLYSNFDCSYRERLFLFLVHSLANVLNIGGGNYQ